MTNLPNPFALSVVHPGSTDGPAPQQHSPLSPAAPVSFVLDEALFMACVEPEELRVQAIFGELLMEWVEAA